MDYKVKVLSGILSLLLIFFLSSVTGDCVTKTNLNLGVEISGHLIPYFGVSLQQGVREVGFNFGMALPHNLLSSNLSDIGYQGELYYRYDFINTDFYPRLQAKILTAPPSSGENEFLLLLGGGMQYLYSPRIGRFGGGLELNLGLPVSALDRIKGPIPYLSLETSYEFGDLGNR